jgi:rod shape-determining protein MreB and related proteins
MLKKFIASISTTFYIQIWRNRVVVTNIKTNERFEDSPFVAVKQDKIIAMGNAAKDLDDSEVICINPFDHPRVVVNDFDLADKFLRVIFEKMMKHKIFTPRVIMHWMDELDGGLSELERVALREIALSAGANDVIVYEGKALDIESLDFDELKRNQKTKR